MKNDAFKKFPRFHKKNLCWCLFFRKLQELQHSCFPAKFAKFLKTPILTNICERPLLRFLQKSSRNNLNVEYLALSTFKIPKFDLISRHGNFVEIQFSLQEIGEISVFFAVYFLIFFNMYLLFISFILL